MLTLFKVALLPPVHLDSAPTHAIVVRDVHPLALPDLGYRFTFIDDAGRTQGGRIVRRVEERHTDAGELLPDSPCAARPLRMRTVEIAVQTP